jgi:polar amino acid transport system substrate-binding protein
MKNESRRRSGRLARHRQFAALALTGLLTVSIAACGSSSGGDASDKLKTVKSGTLTLCGINNYPPMEFVQDGKLVGYDIDLSKAVAEKLGLKYTYNVMAFEGLIPSMQSKRCDAAWSAMYLNEERQKVADPITYLYTSAQALVAAGNPRGIQTEDDLAGKKAAIDASSANLQVAKDMNKALEAKGLEPMRIQEYAKAPDAFQQIRVGRADVAIDGDTVLGYLAKQEPDHYKYVRIKDKADGSVAVYVAKGSPLKGAIAKAFSELKADGTMAKLCEKWGLDLKNLDVITD